MDYIFDIDGTLLDISHRLKFITRPPVNKIVVPGQPFMEFVDPDHEPFKKDWKSFRDPRQKNWDEPILPVIYIMNALHHEGHQIIIATGRTKDEQEDTRKSLATYVPYITDMSPDGDPGYLIPMYLRSRNDYRKDDLVKSDMLDRMLEDGYDPRMVFDDRPSVISMWHKRGLVVADMRNPAKGDF